MAGPTPIPVTLLTGFLGAGKTTLLARILNDPQGVRLGVLVNDFGALDIDAELVVDIGADQISLANGCVCCSMRDDLIEALERLLANDPEPERIVVEASGVSRPLAIVDAFEVGPLGERLSLDAVFCLIDAAGLAELDFASTELALDQALGSDIVILNKCDLATPGQIGAAETTLRGPMPNIRILRTSFAEVPSGLLFGIEPVRSDQPAGSRPDRRQHGHRHGDDEGHGHRHDDEFEAWSWRTAERLDLKKFRAAMRALPTGLLRAKGILAFADRPRERAVLQVVGKRKALELEPGKPPDESRLVAIARKGTLEGDALTALFDGCRTNV
jgi:G3E family GTPase